MIKIRLAMMPILVIGIIVYNNVLMKKYFTGRVLYFITFSILALFVYLYNKTLVLNSIKEKLLLNLLFFGESVAASSVAWLILYKYYKINILSADLYINEGIFHPIYIFLYLFLICAFVSIFYHFFYYIKTRYHFRKDIPTLFSAILFGFILLFLMVVIIALKIINEDLLFIFEIFIMFLLPSIPIAYGVESAFSKENNFKKYILNVLQFICYYCFLLITFIFAYTLLPYEFLDSHKINTYFNVILSYYTQYILPFAIWAFSVPFITAIFTVIAIPIKIISKKQKNTSVNK